MRVSIKPAVMHIILFAVAIVLLFPHHLLGISNTYIEDFSTKQYCDWGQVKQRATNYSVSCCSWAYNAQTSSLLITTL